MAATALKPSSERDNFTRLVKIETGVRRAVTLAELGYVMVNQTRGLVTYRQAALVLFGARRSRVATLSDLPAVDRNTPFLQWLERLSGGIRRSKQAHEIHCVDPSGLPGRIRSQWQEHLPAQLVWVPLVPPQGQVLGALLLACELAPSDREMSLIGHLSETFAHALQLFRPRRRLRLLSGRLAAALATAVVLLVLTRTVHLTALAPAEIVPQDPVVVTAPLAGVVREVLVETNQPVTAGQLLALLDDTEERNRLEMALQSRQVARAELDNARRGAFVDTRSQSQLVELQARLKRQEADVAYARERLARTRLTAPSDGVAITAPQEAWQGRPVAQGEAILQIADPDKVEARILLPVQDAVFLETRSRMRLFLDSDPMKPQWGEVDHFEYLPEISPLGHYAYRLSGRLAPAAGRPRIGLRGTAKLYGPRVSLGYYLFRRPLTFLRQVTGL